MEEKGTVSLWLGLAKSAQSLEDYTNSQYSEDGDFEGSKFTRDFGIGFYDDDYKESEYLEQSKDLLSILNGFSYDEIITPIFEKLLDKELANEINSVILLYDFNYTGNITESSSNSISMKFIGTARYI